MNGDDTSLPFGTPPVNFMQTGNQTFEDSQSLGMTGTLGPTYPDGVNGTNTEDIFASATPIPDPFAKSPVQEFVPPVQNNQSKYKIFDLFWMLNPKFYAKPAQQPVSGEAHFIVMSFNIDFGNLRVSMFNLNSNSIQNNIVYLKNLKRTVSGTIYPATAFNAFTSARLSTTCLEQLFEQIPGASWQQERPVCTIGKNEELIRFTVKDPKFGTYFYDFTGWQREAFLHACNFTFTKGFELMAQQHLK